MSVSRFQCDYMCFLKCPIETGCFSFLKNWREMSFVIHSNKIDFPAEMKNLEIEFFPTDPDAAPTT